MQIERGDEGGHGAEKSQTDQESGQKEEEEELGEGWGGGGGSKESAEMGPGRLCCSVSVEGLFPSSASVL